MGKMVSILLLFFVWGSSAYSMSDPVQVVSEGQQAPCEKLTLTKPLAFYADPSFFLADLGLMYVDPQEGWDALRRKNPVLTTFTGTVWIRRLTKREFKNFGSIARIYEMTNPLFLQNTKAKGTPAETSPHAWIVLVEICGENDPYKNTLGFMLEDDLKTVELEDYDDGQTRPSTRANRQIPIPKFNDVNPIPEKVVTK